jgi:hypothetical protein
MEENMESQPKNMAKFRPNPSLRLMDQVREAPHRADLLPMDTPFENDVRGNISKR